MIFTRNLVTLQTCFAGETPRFRCGAAAPGFCGEIFSQETRKQPFFEIGSVLDSNREPYTCSIKP